MDPKTKEHLEQLDAILSLNKTGFAGILSNGNIVDRREFIEIKQITD